jgi:hypothetical protein
MTHENEPNSLDRAAKIVDHLVNYQRVTLCFQHNAKLCCALVAPKVANPLVLVAGWEGTPASYNRIWAGNP